ncbi:hypothetical protein [Corallococcus sp. 4LFB]|uniref:hypothetical protein n=1 Tax=Corallococcus sp. 4LFB TaxID=3383249 RepID=UPI003975E760
MTCSKEGKVCSVEGCGRAIRARGMCAAHEGRFRRDKPLDAPLKPYHRTVKAGSPAEACKLTGCGRPARCKGLCRQHYDRQRASPGDWSGPVVEYGTLTKTQSFMAPKEHVEAVDAEAKRRGVRKSIVMREALAMWADAQKTPSAKLPRYAREPDDGLLGPEEPDEPELGMTQEAARARADAIIRREYADGVPLTALEERFGERARDVVRDIRRSRGPDERLPFGMPA